jgi:hypothetical protein
VNTCLIAASKYYQLGKAVMADKSICRCEMMAECDQTESSVWFENCARVSVCVSVCSLD